MKIAVMGLFFLNIIFLRKQNKNCPICENLIRERGKNRHLNEKDI